MANQHSFDVIPNVEKDVEVVKNNEHSFSSVFRNSRFFSLIVDTFTASQTLFATFFSATSIVASSMKSAIKFSASITSIISTEITSLLTNVKLSAEVKTSVVIETIIKFVQEMGDTEIYLPTKFESFMRSQDNINTLDLIELPIVIETIPAYKKYYLVSDWDSDLLSDLDGKDLVDMDYQVI